jgi:hypothetical protein
VLAPFLLMRLAMQQRTSRVFLALAAACVGCGEDDYDGSLSRGDLGRGTFVYGCVSESDTACVGRSASALPAVVAVGSLFDVRFSIATGPQPTVASPLTDLVRHTNSGFLVEAAGIFPLLALNGNREVVDIKHLRAAEIDEVRVQHGKELPARALQLAVGEELELTAQPFDADGVLLAGALDYAWTSSDEAVVSVDSLSDLRRVRIRAAALGAATLRVAVSGADYVVKVTVAEAEAASPEVSDAGVADDASLSDGAVP